MALGYRKGLYASQIDGPTLTAAAAATMLPATKITLIPNFFDAIGQVFLIKVHGRISCAVTTPGTARFDVRLGGTVIWDSLAIPLNIVAQVTVPYELDIMLTLRGIGSAATFIGVGRFTSHAVVGAAAPGTGGATSEMLPYNTAPVVGTSFDTEVSQQVDMFFTQTAATGSMTAHQIFFESPRWE
jgi:hypothetical protein